jgi:hypothetical protein
MRRTDGPGDQARRLLQFYAPEVVRLAGVWLDANPGEAAVGVVTPADAPRPEGFVGSTGGEIVRGVVSRAAAETFLRERAPSAIEQLPAVGPGRQAELLVFAFIDDLVLGARWPLGGAAG